MTNKQPDLPRTACDACGGAFKRPHKTKKYCSQKCQRVKVREKYRAMNPLSFPAFDTTAKGAYSELVVCTDLIRRGYSVFRSLSLCSECDVVAIRNGEIVRVEVKTAHKSSSGKIMHPGIKHQIGKFDVLALVVSDTEIFYSPDILAPRSP